MKTNTLRPFAIPVLLGIAGLMSVYWVYQKWNTQSTPGRQQIQHTAAPAPRVAAPTTSKRCPGEPEVVTVEAASVVINPGKRCTVKWRVDKSGSRVELLDTNGRVIRTVGPEGGAFDEFFESVRASGGGKATFYYKLTSS